MVNINVRTLFLSLATMILIGCEAPTDEGDEGAGAHAEAPPSDEPAADGTERPDWAGPTEVDENGEESADWAGPTAVDKANHCWPRIEASGWYCCGRFRECKAVYICEYCTNSKSCYTQGIQERSSPGCY